MRMIDGDELVMWLSKWMISSFGTEPTEETEAIRKVCDAVGDMVKDLAKDTGGDLISRQAAIDYVDDVPYIKDHPNIGLLWKAWVEQLPSAQPKIKIGHWIDIMAGDMQAQACDQCKTFYPLAYTGGGHRFCPNCGAKMIEPQESEDKG